MNPLRASLGLTLSLLIVSASFAAAPPPAKPASPTDAMTHTKLSPAKLDATMCVYRYRVSTTSPACQEYVDQGLGYYYSYVWMEAARSFETAVKHDSESPMAHWMLSRALDRYGRGSANAVLQKAWDLRAKGTKREEMLIKASMEEKGLLPGVGDGEARKKKAISTLDELLATYDDDEEAWYFRAQLAGGSGLFGGQASAVPFYKALLRVNELHPGANHELVHFYENFQRPALGWAYAENYIRSSPGQPHAFHMQAHLATRLGRWQKTSDRSAKAIELQRQYHEREKVTPRQDSQYTHHQETLLSSLVHDGRFREGNEIRKVCESNNFNQRGPFFRLALAERNYDEAMTLAEQSRGGKAKPASDKAAPKAKGKGGIFSGFRGGDKVQGAYMAALVYLRKGEPTRALPEIEVIQQAVRERKNDRRVESYLNEVQGLYLCATGAGGAGLKLLEKNVKKTKDDYNHHAWGNGATFMEAWGVGALSCGKLDVAEEAFHEALAHDPGSVRAALGMQVVCERLGRPEEVERFAALARKCWAKADPGRIEAELSALRGEAAVKADPTKGR